MPRPWAYGDLEEEICRCAIGRRRASGGKASACRPTARSPRCIAARSASIYGEPVTVQPTVLSVGQGPKGWQRSDDRIHDDVCSHLTIDGHVDATEIEVIVHHGEVTLDGTVHDRVQRGRAAVRIQTESVRGAVDVIGHIRVAPSGAVRIRVRPQTARTSPRRPHFGRDNDHFASDGVMVRSDNLAYTGLMA